MTSTDKSPSTDLTPRTQIATRTHVAAAGTSTSNPVFDRILRKGLTDEEAASMARLATELQTGGTVTRAMQEDAPPEALMMAQHKLGVNPALTGVIEHEGQTILTRTAPPPKANRLPAPTSETVAVIEGTGRLGQVERLGVKSVVAALENTARKL